MQKNADNAQPRHRSVEQIQAERRQAQKKIAGSTAEIEEGVKIERKNPERKAKKKIQQSGSWVPPWENVF